MKNNLLPLFKFPTTVALIDDDELFVESVAEYLLTVSEAFKVEAYTSPKEVLNKLNKNMILSDFIKPILPLYKNEGSKISLEFDLQQKYDACEKVITCIVVDYDMPGMSGIEF